MRPDWGRMWPVFELRRFSPSKEPDVLQLSAEDLGKVIDRWGRFDPPQLPAPVGPDGYSFVVAALRSIGITAHVGSHRPDSKNFVRIRVDADDALWATPDLGRRLLDALIQAFEPAWVFAGAVVDEEVEDLKPTRLKHRPWLRWIANGAVLPDFFATSEPPAEVSAHAGGELCFWP